MKTREELRELIKSMTLEEKVRQLTSVLMIGSAAPDTLDIEEGIGQVAIMSTTLMPPKELADIIKNIQDYVLEHSSHKIPVLFHCETLSGPHIYGGNLFPTSISLGATFEPDIVYDMAVRNRRQMLSIGIRQGLAPVLDITRDLRWGRCGETYGEDPTLCGTMGTAFVKGLQGEDPSQGIASTLKHFLGYSCSAGGLNMCRIVTDSRDLRENFAKPYEMAIRDGHVMSVMNSYNEFEGYPICASKEILTDLLRDELGFEGVVVSDYGSVNRLVANYRMTDDITKAGEICLAAGLDMELPQRSGYSKQMVEDIKDGKFDEAYVDTALERILNMKNELGLFDNPYPRYDLIETAFDNTENNIKSFEAAKKSITMTKNDGILPITDREKKLAVIGPMGDAIRALYSAYTQQANAEMMIKGESGMAGLEFSDELREANKHVDMKLHIADDIIRQLSPEVKSILEAIKEEYPHVTYVEGCDYKGDRYMDFEAAAKAAEEADIVIMSVGGRNGFGPTYCTSGEGVDNADIGLPGHQEELVRKVYEANPNMIIVHTDNRPIVSEWIYEHVPAILEAWLPCTFGGIAIAKTITGENNPGGRLPMGVPRTSSHGPIHYNAYRGSGLADFPYREGNTRGYWNMDMTPRLPFGHGLSYTTFAYSDFEVKKDEKDHVTIKVSITNTGSCAGDEVVQLYGYDAIASVVRPEVSLLGFKRITLEPGQKKTVEFTFHLSIMAFYDRPGHWIVEEGEFCFFIGKNCADKIYQQSVLKEEIEEIDYRTRDLIAKAQIL